MPGHYSRKRSDKATKLVKSTTKKKKTIKYGKK